jgi:uncharacterized protein YkwD
MPRVVLLAVVAALLVSGCGGGATKPEPDPAPLAGPATVELTDGRLGGATEARPGSPLRELSPGGRFDLRERDDAPRRDGVGAGAACPNPSLAPAPDSLGAVAEATLCLLNGERADHGLAPLAGNEQLGAAASAYAQDLVAGSYFSHTGRDGSDVLDRIERTGYIQPDAEWALGENLAWGTGALATPGSIMQAWMNSPGHRENILNPSYREIGIGIVTGNPAHSDGAGATYVTEFGEIEAQEAVAATPRPGAKKAKAKAKKSKRRAARKAHRARARASRSGAGKGRGKGGKHRRARGPKARIAI